MHVTDGSAVSVHDAVWFPHVRRWLPPGTLARTNKRIHPSFQSLADVLEAHATVLVLAVNKHTMTVMCSTGQADQFIFEVDNHCAEHMTPLHAVNVAQEAKEAKRRNERR
jgi:hypothetical protein